MSFGLRSRLAVLALTVGTALAHPVHAQSLFNFSYSGGGTSAMGQFTTNGVLVNNHYTITGITGTRNGEAITGLLPAGLYGLNDNFLYTTGTYFDIGGVSFSTATTSSNLFFGFNGGYDELSPGSTATTFLDVSVTPAAVTTPEPSTWALAGIGLAGLGVVTLHRRRNTSS